MAIARTAWGIDVGNRALKAIKLVREGDQLRIDDYEIIEHDQVLSNAGDNRESLVQAAIANFVQRHQTRGMPVAIGVSGQQSFARFIKLPPVEPKKIPEIVRFEAIQQIPFPLEDVEWSYQLFQSPDSPDVEVGIFAMRRELVNQHIKNFTDVDLNVQVVQMNPLAVYNAMYHDGRIKDTTMIIDLGAENTDLVIADADSAWMRSIPIGGNNFTEALVKSFKLNFAKAEELKRNAASSKYARQIFQAMRPVFADLVAEIQRSIGFYASVHRDSRIKHVIALGGTFRLPGLQKYLQQNLQLEVHRLDHLGAGLPGDGKGSAAFSENLLSMVSAYGLAIQGMGDAKIESSLLPLAIRRAKMWQEKTKWFAAAAALFVVGTGVAYGSLYWTETQGNASSSEQTTIQRVSTTARALSSRWQTVEQSGAADRQQIMQIESLMKYRTLWPNLISDIHTALPMPQPAVASGDPEQIKSIPRGQRTQILIDSITTEYVPDLSGVLKMNDTEFKQMAGGAQAGSSAGRTAPSARYGGPPGYGGAPPGYGPPGYGGSPEYGPPGGYGAPSTPTPAAGGANTGERGFLLLIRGTTPNKGSYDFIDKSFVTALAAHKLNAKDPKSAATLEALKKGYYVARATVVSARPIQQSPERLQAMKAAYDAAAKQNALPSRAGYGAPSGYGAPGYGGAPNMFTPPGGASPYAPPANAHNGQANAEDPNAPYLDRVTKEDMRQDSEFTVRIAVVLDPKPPAPADNGGE